MDVIRVIAGSTARDLGPADECATSKTGISISVHPDIANRSIPLLASHLCWSHSYATLYLD